MATNRKFEKGSVVFHEGDYEQCMYRVVSGRVGVYRGYGTEEQTLLTELGEGKIFGELGLIDYMMRSATVVALEDTETEVIGDDEFDEFIVNHTDEAFAVLDSVNARVRALTQDYNNVCRDLTEYASQEGLDVEPSLMERILKFVGFGKKVSEK